MRATSTGREKYIPSSLDAVNFLLADVRGALGPYLNVFLVTRRHWSQAEVGMATTISGLLGIAAQPPIGAAIDETRAKRGVIVLALIALGLGGCVIFFWPSFWPTLFANSFMALAGDVFGPSVAGLTLGLFARRRLARRMGRNSAYDHAGNVAMALIAGAVGYVFSQRAVFLLAPLFALLASIAVLVGRKADTWGRKPLFLLGFGILPLRAALYPLSNDAAWLIGVQLLDGVGAGVYGALTPLVVADLMRGTGRYNLALGAVTTSQGIGASLSGLFAGLIVDHFGYDAAFFSLGAAAAAAFAVFALKMPETRAD